VCPLLSRYGWSMWFLDAEGLPVTVFVSICLGPRA
jgi:hypothetical protein